MELTERKKKVLRSVVDLYIQTAEPVGSKAITELPDMNYSSATIRNEMADLTAMGYLEQPHTSAGRIPAAAGLAGGSTDAAAVLKALNELFDHPMTDEGLRGVGLTLGADVPFCMAGGAQITEGIGEALTEVPGLADCDLVIACGGEGVSTPAAYKALDGLYGGFDPAVYTPHREELAGLLAALREGSTAGVCDRVFNLFETVILPMHPVARGIKETLLASGATTALMSGSGPSVFGIFPKGDGGARRALEALEACGIPAWVCAPAGQEA